MRRVDVPQIAIYITAIACWEGLKEVGAVRLDDVVMAVGLSFGEIVLLTIANAIPFEQGLRFVVQRARAMQEAVLANPGGLVGVGTTDEAVLDALVGECKQVSVLSVLRVKNSTTLLTGSVDALERVAAKATGLALACFRPVDCAAFHSELMRTAVPRVADALDRVQFARPRFPVVSNVTARPFETATIRNALLDNLCSRILWRESLDYILSDAACRSARWLVLEPAEVLAKELTRIPMQINVVACDTPPVVDADK